jgi:hypothetical protein
LAGAITFKPKHNASLGHGWQEVLFEGANNKKLFLLH